MAEKRKAEDVLETKVRIDRSGDEGAVFHLPNGTSVPSPDPYRIVVPRPVCDLFADPVAAFKDDNDIHSFELDPDHPWIVQQGGFGFKQFNIDGGGNVDYYPKSKLFSFVYDGHSLDFAVGENIEAQMEHYRKPQRYIKFALLMECNQEAAQPKHAHWRLFFGSRGMGARYWTQHATWIVPDDELVEALNFLCQGPYLMVNILSIETTKPKERGASFQNPVGQISNSHLNSFTPGEGEELEQLLTYGRGRLFQKYE